jgi:hypothetical protein
LINNVKPAQITLPLISASSGYPAVAGTIATPQPFASQWVELPFAQTFVQEDAHNTLIHGRAITNGIVNLNITMPSAQTDWVLNVSYVYNTTILMSQGTCDFVF